MRKQDTELMVGSIVVCGLLTVCCCWMFFASDGSSTTYVVPQDKSRAKVAPANAHAEEEDVTDAVASHDKTD